MLSLPTNPKDGVQRAALRINVRVCSQVPKPNTCCHYYSLFGRIVFSMFSLSVTATVTVNSNLYDDGGMASKKHDDAIRRPVLFQRATQQAPHRTLEPRHRRLERKGIHHVTSQAGCLLTSSACPSFQEKGSSKFQAKSSFQFRQSSFLLSGGLDGLATNMSEHLTSNCCLLTREKKQHLDKRAGEGFP